MPRTGGIKGNMKEQIFSNFLDPPEEPVYEKSKIVILPVPFDRTSTWIKGSDKGPDAIIQASANIELYDIETRSEIHKQGIFTEQPVISEDAGKMVKEVHEKVSRLLTDGKFVVTLGGEHSVSIGAIGAHAEKFKDLSILHLDAHSDRRDSYQGNRYSHACVMARAKEYVKNIVSVGVRSMDSSELASASKDAIFYAHEIHDSREWINKAVGKLSANVYVTIDVDVFDTGIMPSTGTPEPGGLGWYQVTRLLKAVAEKKNLAGFDVTELCPSPSNRSPDALAAKLVATILNYKFQEIKFKNKINF